MDRRQLLAAGAGRSGRSDISERIEELGMDNLCPWSDKPKDECGCTATCPSCGRRRHDDTKPKCYLC